MPSQESPGDLIEVIPRARPETATAAPPRPRRADRMHPADLAADRLLGRLRELNRRGDRARRHLARPGACSPRGRAYLLRVEGEYEELLGELCAALREAQAFGRTD